MSLSSDHDSDNKMQEEDPPEREFPELDSDDFEDSDLEDKPELPGDPGIDAAESDYAKWIESLGTRYERWLAKQVKHQRLGNARPDPELDAVKVNFLKMCLSVRIF